MDKGLTVPKWVLIVWPKIPQMPKNLSAQFVCPSPISMKKGFNGVRSLSYALTTIHLKVQCVVFNN